MNGTRLQCSGSLANQLRTADLKQNRLLDRLDAHAERTGLGDEVGPVSRPDPTPVPDPVLELDTAMFSTVIWATGFRPTYPWLPDTALTARGELAHDGGIMALPGMYALGMPFQRHRASAFLDGVGRDAEELVPHLLAHLDTQAAPRAMATSGVA